MYLWKNAFVTFYSGLLKYTIYMYNPNSLTSSLSVIAYKFYTWLCTVCIFGVFVIYYEIQIEFYRNSSSGIKVLYYFVVIICPCVNGRYTHFFGKQPLNTALLDKIIIFFHLVLNFSHNYLPIFKMNFFILI